MSRLPASRRSPCCAPRRPDPDPAADPRR